jgi:hypothetical protein
MQTRSRTDMLMTYWRRVKPATIFDLVRNESAVHLPFYNRLTDYINES